MGKTIILSRYSMIYDLNRQTTTPGQMDRHGFCRYTKKSKNAIRLYDGDMHRLDGQNLSPVIERLGLLEDPGLM